MTPTLLLRLVGEVRMIPRSTDYVVCKHVDGRKWLIVFAGNAKNARRMVKVFRRDNPSCKFCVSLAPCKGVGDDLLLGI